MSIDDIINKVSKKHKSNLIRRGMEYTEMSRINFSSPRANWMLYGGIPRGRMIEFAGPYASGKTTTALDIIFNAQTIFKEESNQQILFVDVENTLDYNWAQTLGVDTDSILYFRPEYQSAEEILQITREFAETGEFGLIVLDSIPALVTKAKLDKSIDEKTFCGIAGPFTDFVTVLQRSISKYNTTFIGLNHIKPVIGSLYPAFSYKGGEAWKYYASVRLLFKKGKLLDEKGNETANSSETAFGHKVNIHLNKSKICSPDRLLTFYTLDYKEGIDVISDTIDIGLLTKHITRRDSWYYFNDKKFQGRRNLKEYFQDKFELFTVLKDEITGLIVK